MTQRSSLSTDDKKPTDRDTVITPTICFFPGRGKVSTTRYGHVSIELLTHAIPYYFSYGESAKSAKDDEKKYGEPIKIPLPPQSEDIILNAVSEMPKQFPPLGYNKFSNNCADAALAFMQLAKYQVIAPVKASDLKISEFQPLMQITDPELIAKLACEIRNHAILEDNVKILNAAHPPLTRVILFFENEIKKLENDIILEKIKNRSNQVNENIKLINNDMAQLGQLVIQLTEMKKTPAPYAAILSKLLDYGPQMSAHQFDTCQAIVDVCGMGQETTRIRSTEHASFFENARARSSATDSDRSDDSVESKIKPSRKKT